MIRTIGLDIGSQKTIIVADDGEIVRTTTGSVSFPTLFAFQDKTPRNIGDEATSGDTIIPMINILAGKSMKEIQKCDALSLSKITFSTTDFETSPDVLVKYGSTEENLNTTSLLGGYICKIWERVNQVYGNSVNLAISSSTTSTSTVRSYFDACEVAGLDVSKVYVVDSADAIIAAYARKLSAIRGAERTALDHKLIALVEVGHVQSSVIVVRVEPVGSVNAVTKLAVAHDDNLGCLHFDMKLFDHLAKICESKHSTKVTYGTKRGNRLINGCERLRKLLSQLVEGIITVENLTDNGDVTFSLKRDDFMEISNDLLERLRELTQQALDNAILNLKALPSATASPTTDTEMKGEAESAATDAEVEVDMSVRYVEIFGGGLRMPAVQTLLQDVFGQNVILGGKLDDGSVAIGAALVVNRHLDSTEASIPATFYRHQDEAVTKAKGIPSDKIAGLRAKELELQAMDNDMRQLLAVRNSLESYILEMRGAPGRKFGNLIDATRLNKLLDESEGWVWDHQDANLQEFMEQDQQLHQHVDEICHPFFQAIEADRLEVEKMLEEEATKAAAEKPDEEEDHDNRKLKKADRMRLVVKNKDEGTELFKGGNYRPACARYHKSLSHACKFFDLSPDDEAEVKSLKITLHLNLASCYLKMEKLDQVQSNVDEAMLLDPKNAKTYFRRAQLHEAKKDWEKAYDDAKKCQSLMDMEDKLVKQSIDRYGKEVAKMKDKEKKMWSKAFS